MNKELIVILRAMKSRAIRCECNEQATAARNYAIIPVSRLRCGDIAQKHLCLYNHTNNPGGVECQNCPLSSYIDYGHRVLRIGVTNE